MKKLLAVGLAVVIMLSMVGSSFAAKYDDAFKDVRYGSYYYDAVKWLKDKGVLEGDSTGNFAPGRTVNKMEMLRMFYRLWGQGLKLEPDHGHWALCADVKDACDLEAINFLTSFGEKHLFPRGVGINDPSFEYWYFLPDEQVKLWMLAEWIGEGVMPAKDARGRELRIANVGYRLEKYTFSNYLTTNKALADSRVEYGVKILILCRAVSTDDDGKVGLDSMVSRGQLARILYKVAQMIGSFNPYK